MPRPWSILSGSGASSTVGRGGRGGALSDEASEVGAVSSVEDDERMSGDGVLVSAVPGLTFLAVPASGCASG